MSIKSLKNVIFNRKNQKNILFDHLPKCGGTTVIMYIGSQLKKEERFEIIGTETNKSIPYFKSLPQKERFRYKFVYGHYAGKLTDFVHPQTFCFTIFREPVDRIISHYFYVKREKQHYLYNFVTENDIQLKDYASAEISDELENWYVTYFSGLPIDEVKKNPSAAVDIAYNKIKETYDLWGFQDDIQAVAYQLRQKTGLKEPFVNTFHNKTTQRAKKDEIDKETIQHIRNANLLDLELYNKLKK